MSGPDFSAAARARSFANAARGIAHLFRSQAHAWLHLGASALAVGLGVWLGISWQGWCGIAAALGLVWAAEAFNTALETLADALHPAEHPGVGRAKDVAAGAVLLASLAALALGLFVLGPPLWERLA